MADMSQAAKKAWVTRKQKQSQKINDTSTLTNDSENPFSKYEQIIERIYYSKGKNKFNAVEKMLILEGVVKEYLNKKLLET